MIDGAESSGGAGFGATGRSVRRAPPLAGVAAVGMLLLATPTPGAEPSAPLEPSRTAPRVEVLKKLVGFSELDQFYLVLEPQGGSLTLMYRGIVARRYPVTSTEVGRRRILFVPRPLPADAPPPAWTGGKLDPPPVKERHTLSVDSQGQRQGPEPPLLPPTPEEAVPAPPRYKLRFDGGITLEIVASGDAGGGGSEAGWMPLLVARWADLLAALGLGDDTRVRLRLTMPAAEAGSLYRGLPPEVGLAILPETSDRSGQALLR